MDADKQTKNIPNAHQIFFVEKQPNTQTMDKGLSVPRWVLQLCQKYPKCPNIFRLNLSAQAQKFGIFEKKALSRCPQSVLLRMLSSCKTVILYYHQTLISHGWVLNCKWQLVPEVEIRDLETGLVSGPFHGFSLARYFSRLPRLRPTLHLSILPTFKIITGSCPRQHY